MNLIELYDSAKQVSVSRSNYGQNGNWELKGVVPFVGTKTLLFQLQCFGETVEAEHVVHIQFNNIKYFNEEDLTEPPDGKTVKEIEYKGESYYLIPPTLKTNCTVRCSCPDYYFTFSYWNYKTKNQFGGPPKKYVRKTKTRPPRNPNHHPGICKHIFQAQAYLHTHGYLG